MSLPPRDLALYGRRLVAERMTASGPSSLWTAETVRRFSRPPHVRRTQARCVRRACNAEGRHRPQT